MTATLQPYPAYKDSGVPWLGKVPEHWDMRSLGSLVRPRNERGRPELPLLSVVREKGVIPRASMTDDENHNYVPDDLSNYRVVRRGDLAINKMKAWQGSMGVSAYDGVVSPAYFVYEFSIENLQYGQALLRSRPYVDLFARASDGVRVGQWDLSISGMKRIPVIVPPLSEQVAVVQYLESQDRLIGKYIRAKQKLIGLLNEQKQAIIQRAVTRGLNPDAGMKPSGMEWLGEIPENWQVRRVKQCAYTISKGTTPSTEGRELLDSGPVRFLKAENVTNMGIKKVPASFIETDTDTVLQRSRLQDGDVLFVIAGATLGKTTVVTADILPANTNQAVAFVRPNRSVVPEYLALWLRSPRIVEQTWLSAVQSAQPNLSMADLGSFCCLCPPVDEQRAILVGLTGPVSEVDTALTRAEQQIALMREYRTRMIADVVTGKIDVSTALNTGVSTSLNTGVRGVPVEAVEEDVAAIAEGGEAGEPEDDEAATAE